ncbi:MAG: nucleoside monophosphate kinase [Candidatus Moraniibacteriota bacterium]|nr:MAG: nucleoside monophosphate kinase [Candidatus Moranbacteria bacterium]
MNHKIIGLSGAMGAGKGTVAHYLVDKYGFSKFRMSDVFRDILIRLHIEQTRETVSLTSKIIRETFGQDILSRIIAKDANDAKTDVVVDGIRRETDIEHLRKNPSFVFIYIDVETQLRYDRLVKRAENIGDETKTFQDFLKEQEFEAESQVQQLHSIADYVVKNDGDLGKLYDQIDAIMEKIKK